MYQYDKNEAYSGQRYIPTKPTTREDQGRPHIYHDIASSVVRDRGVGELPLQTWLKKVNGAALESFFGPWKVKFSR